MAEPLFEKVRRIIVDLLAVSEAEVVPTASLVEDLDADSLDLVKLIETLEQGFSEGDTVFTLSDDDVRDVATVGDVVAMLERKLTAD